MKENHTTAVLVQDQGSITGIFTSKDVVLRVIAPGLDPATFNSALGRRIFREDIFEKAVRLRSSVKNPIPTATPQLVH